VGRRSTDASGVDDGDEVARALHDVGELVERVCTPASTRGTRNSQAKELLALRETIHTQARLVTSLRSDLAARSQAVARSEDKRRALEGELSDLRKMLFNLEKRVAYADKQASRARDVAARTLEDRDLAVHRGEDAVRRLEQRHAREQASRDREHAAELERRDLMLAAERDARAADHDAHARELAAERARSAQELAERDQYEACAEQIALDERVAAAKRLESALDALAAEREGRAADAAAHDSETADRERARAVALAMERDARTTAVRRITELEALLAPEREARAIATARVGLAEKALAVAREELAASVAAHARNLAAAKTTREEALAEMERAHVRDTRERARAHAKVLAERERAHAEELDDARVTAARAVDATVESRLRAAEQSLAATRARHVRDEAEWKLELAKLREAAAASERLAQHETELHARARAELAHVCRALEAAERDAIKQELARDAALADLEQQLTRSMRDTLSDSGVRLAGGGYDDDADDDADDDDASDATLMLSVAGSRFGR
jgi:hypothetical protein